MGQLKNALHEKIVRDAYFRELGHNDESECEDCDGFGLQWNNADPTSGQWCQCDTCGDTRGQNRLFD